MKINPFAPNQTELTLNSGNRVLFSYKTPVACTLNGRVYKTSEKFSKTTSRHINGWANPIAKQCGVEVEEKPQSFFDKLVD